MKEDNSNESERIGSSSERRTFLKMSGTTVASLVGVTGATSVSAEDETPSPDPTRNAPGPTPYDISGSANRGSLFKEYLGSGLEKVSENGSDTKMRVSGDWCIENTNTGELPRDSTNIGIRYQYIRIENQSPNDLSVFTSKNSKEIAMNPKPMNHSGGSYDGAMSTTTGALSLAATIAGSVSGGLALGAASLVTGMYALYDNGGGDQDTYKWEGSHGYSTHQGGHHVDFGVEETTSNGGTIKVHSETEQITNSWELEFNGGLQNVTPL